MGVDGLTVTGNSIATSGYLLTCEGGVTGLVFSGNTPATSWGC